MEKITLNKTWVKTDGWRGYYEFNNSVASGTFLYSKPIHNEAEEKRIAEYKKILKKNKIHCRLKTSKTSNVFAIGWDLIVSKINFDRANKLINEGGV